ncbi:MAG: multiheme c-type cytochrome [Acidobacteriota bacterium]
MAKKTLWLLISMTVLTVFFFGSIKELKTGNPAKISTTSSKVCQKCHVEIYNTWKNDLHAMSIEDPMFMASYMESYLLSTGEAKSLCLPCHAPVVNMNKDFDLKMEVTKEGVSCDFCHSIKAVHLDRTENRFEFDAGGKKRGPLLKSSSPAHETEPSDLFKSSEFCASCHEYTNAHGIVILGTFSEWKNSPYVNEDVQCQDCHMPLIEGNVADPKIKVPSQKMINRHAISAAHSTEQLEKAVRVEIKNVEKDSNFIYVEVEVANIGSGHAVPTGIPSRKLILWLELRTPNEYFAQNRIYQRLLKDQAGRNVEKVLDLFQNASEVAVDTRLKPREPKSESFVFATPKNKKITITARLEYLYVANTMSPTEIRVKMAEDSRELK